MKISKWIKTGIILISPIYLIQWNIMFYITGLNLRYSATPQILLFLFLGLPSCLLFNTFIDFLIIIPLGIKLFSGIGKKKVSRFYIYFALLVYLTSLIMTCIFYKQYCNLYQDQRHYSEFIPEVNNATFNTFKEYITPNNFFTYLVSSSKAFTQYALGYIQPNKNNVMDTIFVTPFMWSIRFLFINIWLIVLIVRLVVTNNKQKTKPIRLY